jgi:hypothetical protein
MHLEVAKLKDAYLRGSILKISAICVNWRYVSSSFITDPGLDGPVLVSIFNTSNALMQSHN